MNSLAPTRYADAPAMQVAGVRRTHRFEAAASAIPAQWQEFTRLGVLSGQVGSTAYGVICGGDPDAGTVDYLCGVEVERFDPLLPELGRVRIPAAHYAVFEHRGHVSGLGQLWDAIFSAWLPNSGHQPANSPDFERYDERFDPTTSSGLVEIWVPIEKGDAS